MKHIDKSRAIVKARESISFFSLIITWEFHQETV